MQILKKIIYSTFLALLLLIATLLILTTIPIPGFDMDARVVQSGSMEPALPTGSVIFILPKDKYSEGDIVTYRKNKQETPTTHRIVATDEDDGKSFITKGDANTSNDTGLVKKEEILGSVRFHIPFLGFVINFARQPLGFFLFIIIPAIIISADEVKKIIQEVKKGRSKNLKIKKEKESTVAHKKKKIDITK